MASLNPDRVEWDVIVIGGAAAGENAAQYASQFSGLEAVLVDEALIGGECSYWACMPSKALLHSVEAVTLGKDLPGIGELLKGLTVDAASVLARRDQVTSSLDDSSQVEWALNTGIDVVRGRARLNGVRSVEVTNADGRQWTITARHAVVLDTGSSASIPPIDGLAEAQPWLSRDATNVHEIPQRLVIIGGGVVAAEAATWMRGLGVEELTLIEGGERLLAKQEPFVGDLIKAGFESAGIVVRTGRKVASVERRGARDTGIGHIHGGAVTVVLDDGGQIVADEVLVAAGRTPNSTDLGLEAVGLKADGFVEVDDQLGVVGLDGDWLYAIGDLNGRALLTHMGKYQARIVGEVIAARAAGTPLDRDRFGRHADIADHGAVPQVTFTDPEVGSVGLTEAAARQAGIRVEAVEYDLAALAGTYVLRDHYVGRAKLVIDADRDVLVGVTFVGTGIAELTHSATMAVVGQIPISTLWHVVPSYPTVSEVWLRLLETLNVARHSAS
jgi:pyruvate/2-oxoglutarate dehydrogenase complex dihydrolipoamide dehydrogenase (E3) component